MTPFSAAEGDHHLDLQIAKLGGRETYGRLSNALEIHEALGADETGWPFPHVAI